MTARVLRPVITLTTVLAIVVAALAVYAFLSAGTTHADSTYKPTTTVKLCNAMDPGFAATDPALAGNLSCTDNTTPAAHPDFTTGLNYASGELNFSSVVTLGPTSQTITAIPTGTKVGALRSATTLGTFNAACNTSLTVDFVFFSVALPNNGTPRSSTNIVYPRPQGSANRFDGWQVGSEPPAVGGTAPIDSGVGTATGASIMITNYPSYLLDLLDPDFVPGVGDGGAQPLVPLAVYGGLTKVVGQWIPLYFAQFNAGGITPLPAPYGMMTAGMGAPSISYLNDPSATNASPSSITDFCTPLNVSTMLLGNPSGNIRLTNPAAGTTMFYEQYSASLRDTDQDSYENALDTCPVQVNAGNPRIAASGDTDGDGIDNVCDAGGVGNDTDGDGFDNRQDICTNVSNPGQTEAELGSVPADKGPRTDSVGDECDSEAGVVAITQNNHAVSITMSDSIGNGRYMTVTNTVAKCAGTTATNDKDSDGYCVGNDGFDDPALPACTPNCAARHNAWTAANAPGLFSGMDTDGDGFTDAQETWNGSDPTKSCAQDTTGDNEGPFDNWPFDMNDNQLISGPDQIRFSAAFTKTVNQPNVTVAGMGTQPVARFDLTDDGIVSGPDLIKYSSVFAKTCTAAGIPAFAQQ